MIERRALIDNIEETKSLLESFGAKFNEHYFFSDIIFISENSRDVLRLRISNNKAQLIRKRSVFKKTNKADIVILKKEFNNLEEAFIFIAQKFPNFKKSYKYNREGWHYVLNNLNIYIENIEFLGPSIEIEAKNEEELNNLFSKIKVKNILTRSVPEIIKELAN